MTNYAETVATKCIECGQCTDECDFLIAYGKTPKELANEALNTKFSDNPVLPYSCNICGYCQKLCPENLDLGLMIMGGTRETGLRENRTTSRSPTCN